MHYLFGFGGRINRAKMWLFLLVTLGWEIVVGIVAALGLHWTGRYGFARTFADGSSHSFAGGFMSLPGPMTTPAEWAAAGIVAVLGLVYFVALLAVVTKRLHDRDKSAWWLLPFVIFPWAIGVLKWTAVPGFLAMGHHFIPWGLGWGAADLLGAILTIWAFIELFFFRGTHGENRYGPDPLA